MREKEVGGAHKNGQDRDDVRFLKACLPRLGLRWQGFRKVRKQVIKRLKRRLKELQIEDVSMYMAYLEDHPEEWDAVDGFCRITISRFYRDRQVFDPLRQNVLPHLAGVATARGENELRGWSAGCASGEEVYTLKILWELELAAQFPQLWLRLIATDADSRMIERARVGRYAQGSLEELPSHMIDRGFERDADGYTVRRRFRTGIAFCQQDIRQTMPAGPFHLIMCRNLVFTYMVESVQRQILQQIIERLVPEGVLVIGRQESLPGDMQRIMAYDRQPGIYRRV